MIYCQIKDGIVVNRAVFDEPMPTDWPDYASWVQNDDAHIGWAYTNGAFVVPPPVANQFTPIVYTDPNLRIDAGVVASLQTAAQASQIIHAIPTNFTAQNFAQLLTQMKIVCDAFVSMLQAHATTSAADPNLPTGRPTK